MKWLDPFSFRSGLRPQSRFRCTFLPEHLWLRSLVAIWLAVAGAYSARAIEADMLMASVFDGQSRSTVEMQDIADRSLSLFPFAIHLRRIADGLRAFNEANGLR